MKTLQKSGGFAALYLAVAYLIGMALFIGVLDTLSITDPAQKVALLVRMQMVIFSTNLLMYVFFGVVLIVLALALYDRLQAGAPALMQVATTLGIIWAGSLIASGMVANAGIARRQHEGRLARNEEMLAACIPVRPLGHAHNRQVAQPQVSQNPAHGGKLPLTAIDEQQVWPGGCLGVLHALAFLFQKTREPPREHFAHHAEIIAAAQVFRTDIEFAVLRFH